MCLSGSPAEGSTEEPGDEGSDGSDEEPAVGCQRHADAQEIMVPLDPPFFFFLRRHLQKKVWAA